jgi:hypothetical protein
METRGRKRAQTSLPLMGTYIHGNEDLKLTYEKNVK